MGATYRITHRTEYRYSARVAPSYSLLHLLPRDAPGQRCLEASITVDPAPEDQGEHVDFFGNRVAYVAISAPHRALTVTATSVVEVDASRRAAALSLFGQQTWEEVRDDRDVEAIHYALDSRRVEADPRFAAYAAPSFTPGRQLVEAVTDLSSRIHADFAFAPGETKVDTPLTQVLETRQGVCQDFAHIGIACLRSLGLPARYVSGYLETDPPPGRPKLTGADVSHAWFSVLFPGAGWLDLDPTNDQVVGDRHIVTAYGRDYSDVAPMSGVMYTRGRTTSLKVEVDVVALAPA
ncbi:MAG: transglutaminase family protein [Solirubrobacteraceae bacterium]|nr:transglutaminase family protein [Solirubrobacteraceae bacterium]